MLALLPTLDRGFPVEALGKFESERRKLLAAAETLSPAALEMGVSRLVAMGDNGHTTVGRRLRRLHRVPVRLAWFDEGLFVVRATEAHAKLLGAQVLAINGKTPEALLAGFTPYVSGPRENAPRRERAVHGVADRALRRVAGDGRDAKMEITVRTLGGRQALRDARSAAARSARRATSARRAASRRSA